MRVGMVVLFFAYTAFSVGGLLLLRRWLPEVRTSVAADGMFSRTTMYAGIGALAYVASFLTWMVIVSQVPVGRAYPVSVGLTLTFTAIGARFLLGEPMNVRHVIGIAVVFAGVLLLSLPSGSSEADRPSAAAYLHEIPGG
ncbi:MAG: SMR family transporter [Mycobacteriales bacterium]